MKLALLNTTIITTDGLYSCETISLERTKELIQGADEGIDSAIGHQSTAEILSTLLGIDVPVNRQMFTQEQGQVALVFKLNGRPPEGKILSLEEIQEIGYTFKLLVRVS